jgi:hypothetical protein
VRPKACNCRAPVPAGRDRDDGEDHARNSDRQQVFQPDGKRNRRREPPDDPATQLGPFDHDGVDHDGHQQDLKPVMVQFQRSEIVRSGQPPQDHGQDRDRCGQGTE